MAKVTNRLDQHPYFQRWVDPQSGVASYLLDQRVAPVQSAFYFTSPSLSPDEQWLWFYAGFPPAESRTLGVVSLNPDRPLLRHFPNAQFNCVSPAVAEDGSVYFCARNSVYHMTLEGETRVVCTLSPDYIKRRPLQRLATHLTRSADGRYFLLDGQLADFWFVALGDTQSGEVKVLHEFGREYNHAQFSPTNPQLFLIAQDWWIDPVSGQYFPYENRIWLMDTKQTIFEPLLPSRWYGHGTMDSHEWWAKDGWLCWVDYQEGVHECDVTRTPHEAVKVWQGPLCHAHCDPTRRYFCADESPYKWDKQPCQLRFYDRERGQQIIIASAMPKPSIPRGMYDSDPHPRFSPQGNYITYTTTVRGQLDLALTPVDGVLERLGS